MEYIIALGADASAHEADAARRAVIGCDPAAVVDVGGTSTGLRVATYLRADELRELLSAAGLALGTDAVIAQPQNWCGGCGG